MQDMADGHYVLYSVDENGVFDFCIRFLSIFLYNFIYFFISIIIKVIRFFFSESDCAIGPTSWYILFLWMPSHFVLSKVTEQRESCILALWKCVFQPSSMYYDTMYCTVWWEWGIRLLRPPAACSARTPGRWHDWTWLVIDELLDARQCCRSGGSRFYAPPMCAPYGSGFF